MRESTPAALKKADVSLVELESELEDLLVEYESLNRASRMCGGVDSIISRLVASSKCGTSLHPAWTR